MEPQTLEELLGAERQIENLLRQYNLAQVLISLRFYEEEILPFLRAGIAGFALRFCPSNFRARDIPGPINKIDMRRIEGACASILLADPISFLSEEESKYRGSVIIPTMLRVIGNQFPYAGSSFGEHARSAILYQVNFFDSDETQDGRGFELHSAFRKLNRVTIGDFLKVGFLAFVAAINNRAFTGSYFKKAKRDGIILPSEAVIARVLRSLCCHPSEYRKMYRQYRQKDRRFAAYDFNPLFVKPIALPWEPKPTELIDSLRMVCPIPKLISSRLSDGIYNQMAVRYPDEFRKQFGPLFESYVGVVLENSVVGERIYSERQIQRAYGGFGRKVPDWVVVSGDTVILIECKGTGFSRKVFVMPDKKSLDVGLKPISEALLQLCEFEEACKRGETGLEEFASCRKFLKLVVTHEDYYMLNSQLFKDIIPKVPKLARESGWRALSISELERVQMNVCEKYSFFQLIAELGNSQFSEFHDRISKETGRTYRDSFLFRKEVDLYEALGVKERISLRGFI